MIATNRLERAYEKAQYDLTTFKHIMYPKYQRAAHLDVLDRALMQVSRFVETSGEHGIGRLIIEMPPRHGKTLTTSRLFPAWHLGRNPDHRMMLISYGASLAYKNSRAARNYIKTIQYQAMFPDVKLSDDSAAMNSWNLANYEGGADAMGIDGDPTGKGAHILIIDDPVKSRAEAESEVYREKNWNALTDDLYSRLEPGAAIIIMATRWHMDDLTGRALTMESEGWQRLRLPALAEENDPLGRDIGQALWSDRYNTERLNEIKQAIGEYGFASLYQQRPMPSKAGLFDTSKIEVVDLATVPSDLQTVRFYDLAVTAKTTSDYTAGVKLGIAKDETIYILHVYRVQKNPVDVKNDIIQNAHVDGKDTAIYLETENAGLVQIDYMLQDPALRGYAVYGTKPQGDKYTRAQPFASRVNAGKVKMVRDTWNRAYLDELAVFPMGANDDQVDGTSGAYDGLSRVTHIEEINVPDWWYDDTGHKW